MQSVSLAESSLLNNPQTTRGVSADVATPNGLLLPVEVLTAGFADWEPSAAPDALGVVPVIAANQPAVALHAMQETTTAFGKQHRARFRIGNVGVLISSSDSSELTDMPSLYYLPNTPLWLKGMANLHGNLVPVFDLAAYLGVQTVTSGNASEQKRTKPM